MNLLEPWNAVFFVGFVAYLSIRHVFQSRANRQQAAERRLDGIEIALLVAVTIGALLLPAVYLVTPLLDFADYALPGWAPWTGMVVMPAALWLFYRSHADLGKFWSVTLELKQEHQLVQHGVYRRVRHPMYAAIWLFSFAQALLLQNWLAGWSAVVTFALLYAIRMPREERMMHDAFGQEYADYVQRTGRLIPRFSRRA